MSSITILIILYRVAHAAVALPHGCDGHVGVQVGLDLPVPAVVLGQLVLPGQLLDPARDGGSRPLHPPQVLLGAHDALS